MENALKIYESLRSRPEGANDPSLMLGMGLVYYELGNFDEARKHLGPLVAERKLGTPKKEIVEDGQTKFIDNDQYWEATYKLLHSNTVAAKDDAEVMGNTKQYLGRLYIQWGDQVGGNNWKAKFEELRKQLLPELEVKPLGEATAQTGAAN